MMSRPLRPPNIFSPRFGFTTQKHLHTAIIAILIQAAMAFMLRKADVNKKKQELKNSMTASDAKPTKLRNTTKKIYNYKVKT